MELDPNMLVNALASKNDDGGLGGNSGLLWIFLLILFGGNGFGFGGNRAGDAAVEGQIEAAIAKAQASGLSDTTILNAINGNKEALGMISNAVGVQFEAVRGAISSLSNGLCDLGYKLSQDTSSIISNISAGNASLSRQLADCCCQTQRAIDGIK